MNSNQITILAILIIYMAANAIIGVWMSHQSAKQNADSGFLQNYFMGSRGMGVVKGVLLGSVSQYIVEQSKCPVLVVK